MLTVKTGSIRKINSIVKSKLPEFLTCIAMSQIVQSKFEAATLSLEASQLNEPLQAKIWLARVIIIHKVDTSNPM